MTIEQIKTMSAAEIAKQLQEHQNWLCAWMRAKKISRLRRQRNIVRDVGGARQRTRESVYTP